MKTRTTNPNSEFFDRYGGRGVVICPDWMNSFESFFRDMGSRPGSNYSIERIDNNKGYYKDNCKWATKTEQARNKSSTIRITHNGVTRSVSEWSELTGINVRRLRKRVLSGCSDSGKLLSLNDIDTLEGGHVVCPGDFIITGVKGEYYPCKPDIFKQTYEKVEL